MRKGLDRRARGRSKLALAFLAALAAGCGGGGDVSGGRPDGRPNVVLVSIDTLRADYLSEAPYLSRLAAEGRSFAAMYSSSNWTLPSHVSLFTSQPYLEHHVPPAGSTGAHSGARLPAAQPTLASVLQEAGYATAATTEGGWIRPEFGLDRGFERFSTTKPASAGGATPLDDHLRSIRAFLEERGERPFFLFVHTYWVHDYFVNSAPYHDLTTEADAPFVALGNLLENVAPAERRAIPAGFGQRLYRAGIRRADRFLEDVVELALEGGEPLLVVVTSDHGESLGEPPGVWGHGLSLDDEQIRVPLVAWSPDAPELRGQVRVAASTIDVAPSTLRWLDLGIPDAFRGASDRFLATPPAPSLVLARHHSGSGPSGRTVQALISRGWKYVQAHDFDDERLWERCHDLAADPSARRNLPADGPECARLREAYARLRDAHRPRAAASPVELPEPDPELVEQLRALGYVD